MYNDGQVHHEGLERPSTTVVMNALLIDSYVINADENTE